MAAEHNGRIREGAVETVFKYEEDTHVSDCSLGAPLYMDVTHQEQLNQRTWLYKLLREIKI